jgi:hypothetical protein
MQKREMESVKNSKARNKWKGNKKNPFTFSVFFFPYFLIFIGKKFCECKIEDSFHSFAGQNLNII